MPILDLKGRYILEDNNKLATRSNGSGGFFHSLIREQILAQLESQGVQYIQ